MARLFISCKREEQDVAFAVALRRDSSSDRERRRAGGCAVAGTSNVLTPSQCIASSPDVRGIRR